MLVLALMLAGCTSLPSPSPGVPSQETEMGVTNGVALTIDSRSAPLLEDGPALNWRFDTVVLGEDTIEFATLLPPDFDPAAEYPLLLALPPGGQDKNMVNSGLETFWQRGALYGFIIVSPVKPVGTTYMSDGSLLLPDFVAFLHETYKIAGGKPHLAGVSNGGISTFKAGLERPDLYQSLTVVPGYASADAVLSTLQDLKISLYVGETDGRWVMNSQRTFDELIANGHPDSILEILTGEGHLIRSLSGNGAGQIFERLRE